MDLAILPLIQVATLPRLMMRTPERLTLTLSCSMPVCHLVLSICKSRARTDRVRQLQNKCARNGRLRNFAEVGVKNRCSAHGNPCYLRREDLEIAALHGGLVEHRV